MAPTKTLKKISTKKATIFKIKNRKGYAAICFNNLTEGKTPKQALERLYHPLKRMGYEFSGALPKLKSL